MTVKIIDEFYNKLVESFSGTILEQIKMIYSSLWCSKITKTGNRCKLRANEGSVFCTRHGKPKCIAIGVKSKRQCIRNAIDDSEFCNLHQNAKVIPVKRIIKREVKREDKRAEEKDEAIFEVEAEEKNESVFEIREKEQNEAICEIREKEQNEDSFEIGKQNEEVKSDVNEIIDSEVQHNNEDFDKNEAAESDEICAEVCAEISSDGTCQEEIENRAKVAAVEADKEISELSPKDDKKEDPIETSLDKNGNDDCDDKVADSEVCKETTVTSPKNNETFYTLNNVVLKGDFKTNTVIKGCPVTLSSGQRKGQFCSKPIKENGRCAKHKGFPSSVEHVDLLPEIEWKKGPFWESLLTNYNWVSRASSIKTVGRYEHETGRDNDKVIDVAEEMPHCSPKFCSFCFENEAATYGLNMCRERVEDGEYYCKQHKRFVKTRYNPHLLDPTDSYWSVGRQMPVRWCSQYHFVRLNLFAHLTRNGLIVVGKALIGGNAETLTLCDVQRDKSYRTSDPGLETAKLDKFGGHSFVSQEQAAKFHKRYKANNSFTEKEDEHSHILRCHNNGLLYKILPQEYLMYHHDITNLDELPGKGFISFEQMIRDRPSLYIKYWKVWNKQIKRALDFLQNEGKTVNELFQEFGTCDFINWPRFKEEGFKYGLFNLIIPEPTLEQVKDPKFNPFLYCERWVEENCPEKANMPHFPPMYILYPFPDDVCQRVYKRFYNFTLEDCMRSNRENVSHYYDTVVSETPYVWLQWLKFGHSPNLFESVEFDLPLVLQKRVGCKTWLEFNGGR